MEPNRHRHRHSRPSCGPRFGRRRRVDHDRTARRDPRYRPGAAQVILAEIGSTCPDSRLLSTWSMGETVSTHHRVRFGAALGQGGKGGTRIGRERSVRPRSPRPNRTPSSATLSLDRQTLRETQSPRRGGRVDLGHRLEPAQGTESPFPRPRRRFRRHRANIDAEPATTSPTGPPWCYRATSNRPPDTGPPRDDAAQPQSKSTRLRLGGFTVPVTGSFSGQQDSHGQQVWHTGSAESVALPAPYFVGLVVVRKRNSTVFSSSISATLVSLSSPSMMFSLSNASMTFLRGDCEGTGWGCNAESHSHPPASRLATGLPAPRRDVSSDPIRPCTARVFRTRGNSSGIARVQLPAFGSRRNSWPCVRP